MSLDTFNAFAGEEHQPFTLKGGSNAALLVHGFPGSPAEMQPLAALLNQRGWTTRAILLPGFGAEFEHIVHKTKEDWKQAILTELRDLQRHHQHVVLIGNSMGGALSIEISGESTSPPDALILFAPFWKVSHLAWNALPLIQILFPQPRLFKYLNLDFNNPEVRKGILNFMPGADLDNPQVQQAIRDFRVPVKMFAQIHRAGKAGYQYASKIRQPTLVIQGRQDELVLPTLTKKLIARFHAPVHYVEVDAEHNAISPSAPGWNVVQESIIKFTEAQRKSHAAFRL